MVSVLLFAACLRTGVITDALSFKIPFRLIAGLNPFSRSDDKVRSNISGSLVRGDVPPTLVPGLLSSVFFGHVQQALCGIERVMPRQPVIS